MTTTLESMSRQAVERALLSPCGEEKGEFPQHAPTRAYLQGIIFSASIPAKITVQATGIAVLHACFVRGNPPYCTQIPQEKHAWNTGLKKIHETRVFDLVEFLHCWLSECSCTWAVGFVIAKIKLSRQSFKCKYFMLSGLKVIQVFWPNELCFLPCKVAHDSFLDLNFGEPILVLFFSWCSENGVSCCILKQATTIMSALRAFCLFCACFVSKNL